MLDATFQHLPGLGEAGERRLWAAGVRSWRSFLARDAVPGIGRRRKMLLDPLVRADLLALERREFSRFWSWPTGLHHRALGEIDRVVYLDIETYGVRERRVALIGLSDGEHMRILNGSALDRSTLEPVLARTQAVVTFNGNRFDLPYLERAYRIERRFFAIDLEPLCRRAGLIGGLKSVERRLGIRREHELRGGDPLALWRSYVATGDEHFMAILSSYLEQDVLSLPEIERWLHRQEGGRSQIDSALANAKDDRP